MRMLWIAMFLLANDVLAASISGQSGSLIYSDEKNGVYHSLIFKGRMEKVANTFDVGLAFNFTGDQLSPDKSYSVVSFSEYGVLDNGAASEGRSLYLCAFVRMSDGCVVAVESGGQCGGEWAPPNRWVGPLGDSGVSLLNHPPSIEKTYKDYSSGRKDKSQVSNPKVMAYLLEGTSFQNLLTCDPPDERNKSVYNDFLTKLQRDTDAINARALKSVLVEFESGRAAKNLNGSSDIHVDDVVSGPFQAKIVTDADVFFSRSSDENYPVRFMLKRKRGAGVELIDKYEVSGSAPNVETVFYYPINGEVNILVLVSWEINSRGLGTYGRLYQVYAYKSQGGKLVRNDQFLKDNNISGIDGYQEGQQVSFSLRNAESIKKYIDAHREYK